MHVIDPYQKEPLIWYKRIPATLYRVKMLEDYVANGLSIRECANKHGIDYSTCCKIIERYFAKPVCDLTLTSAV